MRVLPALLLLLTACESTQDVPAVGARNPAQAVATRVTTAEDLASRLRGSGLDLTFVSTTQTNARSSGGRIYETDTGGRLFVFEYPSEDARDADLEFLLARPGTVRVYTYARRLAVVFRGTNPDVIETLDETLAPVAER